jgi:hypothetical protein
MFDLYAPRVHERILFQSFLVSGTNFVNIRNEFIDLFSGTETASDFIKPDLKGL